MSRRNVVVGGGLAFSGLAVRLGWRALARQSLPTREGTLAAPCLDAPVEVVRDRYGIPHIYASGLLDVVRAQGYVHAQDRLFQMTLLRGFAHGRLAEVGGPRALELDRLVRRLRIARVAEREADCADPEAGALADAYAEGVNACLEGGPLPLELRMVRFRPSRWRRADVFAPGKVLSLGLGVNWESELLRMQIAERLGRERLTQLDPSMPSRLPTIVAPELAAEVARTFDSLRWAAGGGSNSWAVSGSRTRSGSALLANDPHLLFTIPCVWQLQHLSWDGGSVAGLTIPGAPLVVAGRNEHVAWGMTAANVDTQDLYVERFDLGGRHYEADGQWRRAEVVEEQIKVRGRRKPVHETVLLTRHGPVIAGPEGASRQALALRWSALEPGQTLRSLIDLARSTSIEQADRAFDRFAGPPQNILIAERGGAIAYRLAGGPIPQRKLGEGLTPAPGWASTHEWRAWIPQDRLPRIRNPKKGFIVTANNRIVDERYPYFLGAEYMNGYRARRIEMLLEDAQAVSAEDCCRIQLDQVSLPGLELAEIARAFVADDALEQAALDLLAAWDGRYDARSAAGAVYGVLMRSLQEEAFSELGEQLLHFLGAGRTEVAQGLGLFERTRPMILEMLAERTDSFFVDGRTWEQVFRKALRRAVRALGPDPALWRWGRLHRMTFEHPFDEVRLLRRLFNRGQYAVGGDTDTVWQMAWPVESPYGPHAFGPSARAVYDLSGLDENRVMIVPGQSGHLASPHYDDMIDGWFNGRYVPLAMTRERVESLAESRLVLTPHGEPARPRGFLAEVARTSRGFARSRTHSPAAKADHRFAPGPRSA